MCVNDVLKLSEWAGGHREELCPPPDQTYQPIVPTEHLHTTHKYEGVDLYEETLLWWKTLPGGRRPLYSTQLQML